MTNSLEAVCMVADVIGDIYIADWKIAKIKKVLKKEV